MTARPGQRVLILGAGVSGLAAAYHLRTRGYAVTVLDHRAWRADAGPASPPPPIYLPGGRRESLNLLHALDSGQAARTDDDIPLEFQLSDARIVRYRPPRLPAPLHWIAGLLGFSGLAWRDRWNLLSHLDQIWEGALPAPADLENRVADDWLASIGQTRQARNDIWAPLAYWLTDNALARLSAAQFARALSHLFLEQASHTRLMHLHERAGDWPLTPLTHALQQLDTTITLLGDVPRLQVDLQRVTGVFIHSATPLQADWYLSALPHRQLVSLLPERLLTRYAYFSHISELTDLAGLTIRLVCRMPAGAPRLILRARHPFPKMQLTPVDAGTVHVELSDIGNPSLLELNDTELGAVSTVELRTSFPAIAHDAVESMTVVRNKHAALSLHPGAAMRRPLQRSPVHNLLLTGAWTDTGWPANLESALVSARRCAEIIAGQPAVAPH